MAGLTPVCLLISQLDPAAADTGKRLDKALREAEGSGLSPAELEVVRRARELLAGSGDARQREESIVEIGRLLEWVTSVGGEDEPPAEPLDDAGDALEAADDELLSAFLVEAQEHLADAETGLLAMEADVADREACNSVFRAFHTIKGAAGFLQLDDLSGFAHEAETILEKVRDGTLPYDGDVPDLMLRSVDVVRALLGNVEESLDGRSPARPAQYEELIGLLRAASDASPQPQNKGAAPRPEIDPGENRTSETPSSAAEASIRVRTDRLDRLIDLMGELVIAQSMTAQDRTVIDGSSEDLARKVSHAGKIIRELQDLSVSLRMVPLRGIFQRMNRVARDVARKQGKRVEVAMVGEDTEIDRGIVDLITDPLIHMIRNAVDHGVEGPAERAQAGKPAAGRITLSAHHASGNVVVEVKDDGRGLDRERILSRAMARGIVGSGASLTDSEILNLIFTPGFSTAEKVTDVSGRGVGMDVVKRHVERLRGRIDIASTPGGGTCFTIHFPLTLAITDAMLVRVGQERYLVPTSQIHLSFRPPADTVFTVHGRGEVVRLRQELLPVVRLHPLLDIPGAATSARDALLIVVSSGQRRCAIMVDELLGQHQVVAKSLGTGVGRITGISGGAILGDGRVGLILEIGELMTMAAAGTTRRDDDLERSA